MRYPTLRLIVLSSAVLLGCGYAPSADAEPFTQDLAMGSIHPEVELLEEVLCQQGPEIFPECADDDYLINDIYGPITEGAVIRFQYSILKIRNPDVLGRVEEKTRRALNALLSSKSAPEFNSETETMQAAYRATHTGESLAALDSCLRERCEEMEMLFDVNPAKARELAFSKKFRKRTPKSLRYMIEEEAVTIKGTYQEIRDDQPDFPYARSVRKTIVTTKGVRYTLPRDTVAPNGAKMRIRGIRLENRLIPGPTAEDFVVLRSTFPTDIVKPGANVRLAAILLEFPDLRRNNTQQEVQTGMNEISTFMAKASYGQTQVTVQTTPWLMSTRTWGPPDYLACRASVTLQEALNRAASHFDYHTVKIVIPVMPEPQTPALEQGEEGLDCAHHGGDGSGGSRGFHPVSTPDGTINLGVSYVNDGILRFDNRPNTQIHEFIHGFNVGHQEVLQCSNNVIDGSGKTCQRWNPPHSVMGAGAPRGTGWSIGDLDAKTKDELGWFNSTYVVQKITTPGTYTVGVLERQSPGVKALQLDRNNSEGFWIEYRRSEGNDAETLVERYEGAFIHALLPEATGGGSALVPPKNVAGNPLFVPVGSTWYDDESEWAITPTAKDANSLTVRVEKINNPVGCTPKRQAGTVDQAVTFRAFGGAGQPLWRNVGGQSVSGSGTPFNVVYTSTGTKTIEVYNSGNGLTDRCVVEVAGAPTIEMDLNHSPISAVTVSSNENLNIEWTSSNSLGCGICYQRRQDGLGNCQDQPLNGSLIQTVGTEPRIYWGWCAGQTAADFDWGIVNTRGPVTPATPEGNNAECQTIEARPSPFSHDVDTWLLHAGEARRMILFFRNTGTTTWSVDDTPHRAVMVDPNAAVDWSRTTIPLRQVVEPGGATVLLGEIRFTGSLCSGCQNNIKPVTWRMSENGVPFGQECRTVIWPSNTTGNE